MATIGTLHRMTAKTLSEIILAEANAAEPTYAIIDVRDDGGHIKTSQHVPSGTLDALLPTLRRKLADKRTVVFHCALSQQRGPSAALRYLRDLETAGAVPEGQKVYVLDKGFVGWAAEFGPDERLTDNFRKELWEGY